MDTFPTSTGSPRKRLGADAWRVCALLALASAGLLPFELGAAEPELLPPEQAFRFAARALDDRTLEARFTIADGYYLYRDKLRFAVADGVIANPLLPPGKMKTDEFFGRVETYRGAVVVKLPLGTPITGRTLVLAADSQGCADAGVCYPPTQQKVTLELPAAGRGPGKLVDANPAKKNWFN